jgi:phospholipid/cholesterol/gamma-HCH transport system substrate-binding protein
VTVGQVKRVSVERDHALVKFVVDPRITLRESTQVGMRFQNVIGAKFLYLYPGSSGEVTRAGHTFALDHSVGGADVGNFLTDIGAFLKALNPNDINAFTRSIVAALQDNDMQVSDLIDNSASVSRTVGGLDAQVGRVIVNLQQILSALAARNADLASVADHLASVSSQLAARNDVLDNVVGNFGRVNGELNTLLTDNRGNVDQIIANLQAVSTVLAQHHADLNNDLATLSSGFAPYTLISAYGQWFQIRVVYTCLGRQASCAYEDPSNPPTSLAGPGGGPARPLAPRQVSGGSNVGVVVSFALHGRAAP